MDEILRDLNDAQRAAVTHRGAPLLVVAGAGSGKTRVITRRVAHLVLEGVPASRVLAITFTNKASREMKERVTQLLPDRPRWISTFHAFGARFLRIEAATAGVDPNFTVLDPSDQLVAMKEVLKELKLGTEHRPREYLDFISQRKNALVPARSDGAGTRDEQVYAAYEKLLAASHALDFDDLLVKALAVLDASPDVRDRWSRRFDAILVDEYQDTNRVQYELLRRVAGATSELCATGDPDQSIYKWRGADIRNILGFADDFPGTRVVKLEENYRSPNRILRAASGLIAHNTQRVERDLRSGLGDGELLKVIAGDSEQEEAARVVAAIHEELRAGTPPPDVVVLYRTNACSRSFEQELRRFNIPYQIVGATEFYERREVKDLLAYLRTLANPYDTLDLLRILNVPSRGIGTRTIERLGEHARLTGRPLRDVVLDAAVIAEQKSPARAGLEQFATLFAELAALPRWPVARLLEHVIDRTDYTDFLEDMSDPVWRDRVENVEELRRALTEYDESHPDGSLDDFLAETALLRSRDDAAAPADRITLMTIHSAKGLEYPVVFVAALEEGMLPHARSLSFPDDLEEERRLLYVAITRARRRLTLSYSRRRTGFAFGSGGPSRFLREIPVELFEGGAAQFPLAGRWGDVVAEPAGNSWYEPEPDGTEPPFEEGDLVFHQHFGTGRVLGVSGFGRTAKVTVDFETVGEKRLVLEYANLRKSGS